MSKVFDVSRMSAEERQELVQLGVISPSGDLLPYQPPPRREGQAPVPKKAVSAPSVLNEAYAYEIPSSFSRAMRVDLGDVTLLFISGTASINEKGETVHVGDFRAQCWRTYRNITQLLEAEGATWHDVVRCTCYLRDIERDYEEFNRIRTAFFKWMQLDPLPASVGVQARLCRSELLVEIEALAIVQKDRG